MKRSPSLTETPLMILDNNSLNTYLRSEIIFSKTRWNSDTPFPHFWWFTYIQSVYKNIINVCSGFLLNNYIVKKKYWCSNNACATLYLILWKIFHFLHQVRIKDQINYKAIIKNLIVLKYPIFLKKCFSLRTLAHFRWVS